MGKVKRNTESKEAQVTRRSFLATCAKAAGTVSLLPDGLLAMAGASGDAGGVCVLDGPAVHHMRRGLERIACPYRRMTRLNAETLERCSVLILSGRKPPVGARRVKAIRDFLEAGGAVLAVGGGATCMIDTGLFDAEGYYPTGTSIHQSTFDGYHRLTFGYPGAKPETGWSRGVPMLLRATEGPLMELGSKPTSILTYGHPFSAAAYQPVGKGMALLIGPDPQGGDLYSEVDRSRLTTGEKLKTDMLLANAIAFLTDRNCNIIPNAGFEENTELRSELSNWDVDANGDAKVTWVKGEAPEGSVFLKLACLEAGSSAAVKPYRPLVVERGWSYTFRCRHRSSAGWEVAVTYLRGNPRRPDEEKAAPVSVPPSRRWKTLERSIAVPDDVSTLRLELRISGKGELSLDDLSLRRNAGGA